MNRPDLYKQLIIQICKDFHEKYTNSNTVHLIIDQITSLPPEVRHDHTAHIHNIRNTIKSYDFNGTKFTDAKMTDKQISTLYQILCMPIDYATLVNLHNHTQEQPNTSKCVPRPRTEDVIPKSSKSVPRRTESKDSIVKLDKDEFIFEIVNQLIANLKRNVMSSTITLFVQEYLESATTMLESNIEKYHPIVLEIQRVLEQAGWSTFGQGGFKKEPDRLFLLKELQVIVGKFF